MTTATTQLPAVEDERIPDKGDHLGQREHLLRHAPIFLNRDDRLQASEKMWGAVAQTIAYIADERGWEYKEHRHAGNIARHLGAEAQDRRIGGLYRQANGLHSNFYSDERGIWDIVDLLPIVKELIERLDAAHQSVPHDIADPHVVADQQVRIAEGLEDLGLSKAVALPTARSLEYKARHLPHVPATTTIDGRRITMKVDGSLEFGKRQTEHRRRPRSRDGGLRDRNGGPR